MSACSGKLGRSIPRSGLRFADGRGAPRRVEGAPRGVPARPARQHRHDDAGGVAAAAGEEGELAVAVAADGRAAREVLGVLADGGALRGGCVKCTQGCCETRGRAGGIGWVSPMRRQVYGCQQANVFLSFGT